MSDLRPHWDDISEEDQIEMIQLLFVFDGKIDGNFVLVELHLQIFLFLDHKGDLDSHLGWSLIPRVSELGAQKFLFSHVFLPHLDYSPFAECLFFRLFDSLQQISAHQLTPIL